MTESTPFSYVSVDIETTGPSPANSEMCSIGACYLDDDLEIAQDAFAVNLDFVVHNAPYSDPDTMTWWKQFPEQWKAHRENTVSPEAAMDLFVTWLDEVVTYKPVFVAWPVGFDWGFINYYLHKYVGGNPFGYSPMCLKNYAAGLLRKPAMLGGSRSEATMPDDFLVTPESIGRVSHIALDDAIAQAVMLRNILTYDN